MCLGSRTWMGDEFAVGRRSEMGDVEGSTCQSRAFRCCFSETRSCPYNTARRPLPSGSAQEKSLSTGATELHGRSAASSKRQSPYLEQNRLRKSEALEVGAAFVHGQISNVPSTPAR